ncbi:MAG: ABC transporter substrate-binding protein [Actinomyces succiniciruminis]|nr:ABC transporter substrate-binding protein [Actinomyces succiniciruminis]
MNRRTFLFASAVAATLGTVAACAPGSSGGSGPSADGASQASGEVTIWHYWDGTNADAFDAAVQQYQDEHPDTKMTVVNVPNSDMLTKIQTAAQTDTLPTMVIGDLVWAPQISATGKTVDLSTGLSQDVVNAIYPSLIAYGSDGDALRSVPVSANNLGLLYNKDLYTEAGLDPDTPPETWEELRENGKTILEKTGKPPYELYTQAGDNGEGLTWNFQVNLWQAGGQFLNEDNTAAAFNTEEGKKALQFWVDLIDEGLVPSPSTSWGEFEKGSAAAAQEGSWMVGIWQEDPPFDFGAGQAPYPEDGKAATNLGGEQALVFEGDGADAAIAFLSWFLETDQVLEWCKTTGMLPVRQDVGTSDDYTSWVAETQPLLQPYVDAMETANTRPATPLYPKASYAFAVEVEKALNGTLSVDEALQSAEDAVNKALSEGN